jgi:multiple sugar transport system substrate-binding protein
MIGKMKHFLAALLMMTLLNLPVNGNTTHAEAEDGPGVGALSALVTGKDIPDGAGNLTFTNQRIPIHWFVGLGTGTQPGQIVAQQEVVDQFNASQSVINLTLEVVDNGSAHRVLMEKIAAGDAPDIVGPVGIRGSNTFAGQWLDLTPLIQSTGFPLNDFDPGLLEFYQRGSRMEAMPLAVYPSVIFYNKDLFDTAGLAYPPHKFAQPYADPTYGGAWTIEKMSEIARRLTLDETGKMAVEDGFDFNKITQFGFHPQWAGPSAIATLFGPGSYVNEQGNAQMPAHWWQAYQWYYAGMWSSQPFIPNAAYSDSDAFGNSNVFSSGRLAMANIHTWYTCCINQAVVPNWDIAVTPSYSGVTTARLHADSFFILKSSLHPVEAFQVVSYLTGTAGPKLLDIYSGFPARLSQQAAAVNSLYTHFPGVDWQVMIDSLAYPDRPNHEDYMPGYLTAWNRTEDFRNQLIYQAGLDVDLEINHLLSDLQIIFNAGIQTILEPNEANSLAYHDKTGLRTIIQVPAEAVEATSRIGYAPLTNALPPAQSSYSGYAFDLSISQNEEEVENFIFSKPITVTLLYDQSAVVNIKESTLSLYLWNGTQWTAAGVNVVSRDVNANRVSVTLAKAGRYAWFGQTQYDVFVPMIKK